MKGQQKFKSDITLLDKISKLLMSPCKIINYKMKAHKMILCLASVVVTEIEFRQNSHRKKLPQSGGQWH